MCNETSPENFRPDVEDVIFMLTNGAHNALENQTKLVDKHSRILKKKNITIVGLRGSNVDVSNALKSYNARSWALPKLVFKSIYKFDKIVNKIVDAACASPGKAGE